MAEPPETAPQLAPAFYDALASAAGELDRFEQVEPVPAPEPEPVLAPEPEPAPEPVVTLAAVPDLPPEPDPELAPEPNPIERAWRDVGGFLSKLRRTLFGG